MTVTYQPAALLMDSVIREITQTTDRGATKVLDFGAGKGELMAELLELGYDAWGCDVGARWIEANALHQDRFAVIATDPYRLPYEDDTFDAVVSTSVLEHALNKEEVFREIRRVLKQGGYAIHLHPGKWYLPIEPHLYVPLVNWFWPRCPRWWFALWALAGIRNEYQQDMPWRKVVSANLEYARTGLSYWSHSAYRELSMKVFGNYTMPHELYVRHGYGGVQRVLKRLPFQKFTGGIASHLRMGLLVNQKR